jgi:hypothetical protein
VTYWWPIKQSFTYRPQIGCLLQSVNNRSYGRLSSGWWLIVYRFDKPSAIGHLPVTVTDCWLIESNDRLVTDSLPVWQPSAIGHLPVTVTDCWLIESNDRLVSDSYRFDKPSAIGHSNDCWLIESNDRLVTGLTNLQQSVTVTIADWLNRMTDWWPLTNHQHIWFQF